MTAPPFRIYTARRCAGCAKELPSGSLVVARQHWIYCTAECADANTRTGQREMEL